MKIVADTGALYALMDKSDWWHQETKAYIETSKDKLIVPSPVLPEICYLANKYLGWHAEHTFLKSIVQNEITIHEIKKEQFQDILYYIEKYKDSNIGFVDAAVIVAAESLNISTIFTIDKKHFSIIRTKAGKHFEIAP